LAMIFCPSRPCQSTWRNNLYHPVKHLEALALQGRDLFQAPSGYGESATARDRKHYPTIQSCISCTLVVWEALAVTGCS
jgi:hypothetical protein